MKHFLHHEFTECIDNDTLALGRAFHCMALEPHKFDAEFAIWSGERRYGKEWEKFKLQVGEKTILTGKKLAEINDLSVSVKNDKHCISILTDGRSEQVIKWTDPDTGLKCKGCIDWIQTINGADFAIYDLKTAKDASPDGFGRSALDYNLHMQAAFYQDGYAECNGGVILPFSLIAVEKMPPYVVQVYNIPDDIIEIGRKEYKECLGKIAELKLGNIPMSEWPGYADGPLQLQLPRWAMKQEELESTEELGLDKEGVENE
jgi:hypothetical protein